MVYFIGSHGPHFYSSCGSKSKESCSQAPKSTGNFHKQSSRIFHCSTFLSAPHPLAFAFPFIHNVQVRTPLGRNLAPIPLNPSQCDFEALPHDRAAAQDIKELEELGGQMGSCRWSDLLLQHLHRLCRGASLYDSAARFRDTLGHSLTNPQTPSTHPPRPRERTKHTPPSIR